MVQEEETVSQKHFSLFSLVINDLFVERGGHRRLRRH